MRHLDVDKRELQKWEKEVNRRQYDRMYNRISISQSKVNKRQKKRNK